MTTYTSTKLKNCADEKFLDQTTLVIFSGKTVQYTVKEFFEWQVTVIHELSLLLLDCYGIGVMT